MKSENRIRLYFVPSEALWGFIQPTAVLGTHVVVWKSAQLPADVKCLAVYTNYERRGFDFVLSSESFEEVEEGVCAPRFVLSAEQAVYEIKQPQEHPQEQPREGQK